MTQPPARSLGTVNTCANCLFFEEPASGSDPSLGHCRYPAPSLVLINQQGRAIWPWCRPQDWCGQWAAIA